jgi:hypothetical protein
MKKIFCGVMVLLMVSLGLGLFISCNKNKSNTSTNSVVPASESKETAIVQKDPIVIDWDDFKFTKGYNVPGTIFQANFLWGFQDGTNVNVEIEGTYRSTNFQNAPKRYDFKEKDPVTVVFRVTSDIFTHLLDIISINPR